MDPVLTHVANTVFAAKDLEGLTRPLLQLLEMVTGLESTYLTRVDEDLGVQHILYARNSRHLRIPEGLSVPWHDTLCKRALEEGKYYTDDVGGCWGDSDAAKGLGIQTYLSQPVRTLNGGLYGTLCAASDTRVEVATANQQVVNLFAQLIAHQVEREQALAKMHHENEELSSIALTDPLTGLANRRALDLELRRMFARARRNNLAIQVGFIDLDGFKAINDLHGHEVGDSFLIHIAKKLATGIRAGDFVARYGGDEFVVLTPDANITEFRSRIENLTIGRYEGNGVSFDYQGGSVGFATSEPDELDVEKLLARADAAMYEAKKARATRTKVA